MIMMDDDSDDELFSKRNDDDDNDDDKWCHAVDRLDAVRVAMIFYSKRRE